MDMPGLVVSGEKFAPNYSWIFDLDTVDDYSVPVEMDHATVDATLPTGYPAGLVRSGLVLGKITSSGKYAEYDNSKSNGQETAQGILLHPIKFRDVFKATLPAGQVVMGILVVGGVVDSSKLYGLDAAGLVELQALKTFVFRDLY